MLGDSLHRSESLHDSTHYVLRSKTCQQVSSSLYSEMSASPPGLLRLFTKEIPMLKISAHSIRQAFVVLCLLLSCACTYEGALKDDFYAPTGRPSTLKFPLGVALIADERMKTQPFEAAGGGYGLVIQLNPAFTKAVKSELESIFERVDLVESVKQVKEQDLIAVLKMDIREITREELSGYHKFEVNMQVTFKEVKSKSLVSVIEKYRRIDYTPPGETFLYAILNGFSLFLLAPITVPLTTEAIGSSAMEILEREATILLLSVGADIREDEQILEFVNKHKRP